MSKRHQDAIAISDGAVNISGMAYSLIEACAEAREHGVTPSKDAACKLIVAQMAYIAGIWDGCSDWPNNNGVYCNGITFSDARMSCRRINSRMEEIANRVKYNLPVIPAPITKAQRQAIKRVFDRAPIYQRLSDDAPISYRQFRKTACAGFGGEYVTIPWNGMVLAIEKDGYIHS